MFYGKNEPEPYPQDEILVHFWGSFETLRWEPQGTTPGVICAQRCAVELAYKHTLLFSVSHVGDEWQVARGLW